jgi:hypothetical protein
LDKYDSQPVPSGLEIEVTLSIIDTRAFSTQL